MNINFFQEDVSISFLDEGFLAQWLSNVIVAEGKTIGDLSLVFCTDDYLLELNKKHLNHDYFTDILSFDYCEGCVVSGDLYISWDRVRENAAGIGVSEKDELNRVCVHGVLHLCGYKDKSPKDKSQMTLKEDFYLKLR